MNNIINNLSMRGKLITLVVPVLLVIIYFAAESIALNTGQLGDMRQLRSLVQLADIGDPLIETLQKERGRSAVVLSSGSDRDAARQAEQALTNQRRQTDTRLSEYHTRISNLTQEASFTPAVTNSIQAVEQDLAALDRLRSNVDNGSINGREAEGRYTQLITDLLNRIPLVISRSTDPELTRNINAYYALAEAAESAGKERAAGAAMISAINQQINSLPDGVRFAIDNKDLTQKIHISSKDEIGTIGRAINELFGRFDSALQHIDRASVQLATATEETSSTAGQNATQTKSQQEQIEQVAAATEEMSATSEQISRNTQQVADAANTVMVRSRAGEEVLQGSVRR